MSAPVIWIILPAVAGISLYFLRRKFFTSTLVGAGLALLLALLARFVPIGRKVDLGFTSFKLLDTLEVLGRRFTLAENDRFLLVLIYALAAFWFAAVYTARAGRSTVPLGLLMVALLTAALAVEPSLYAALLVEMTALVCIPILIQPDMASAAGQKLPLRGSLRFLIFQTMGMPLLLLTGWLLAGVETTPSAELALRAASLMGFGFALLLAIFPFHSWVLMLAEEAHPYTTAFVFVQFSWMVLLYGLHFLDRYPWLRGDENVLFVLRLAGVMMVVVGGGSAWFEHHLGRMMGYAVMMETGYNLLAASIPNGLPLVFGLLLPRMLALGTWALALVVIQEAAQSLDFKMVVGLGRKLPFATLALILAQLSIAGVPLLAAFPLRLILLQHLSSAGGLTIWWVLAGSTGLLIAAARTLTVLVSVSDSPKDVKTENRPTLFLLGLAVAAIFVVGMLPDRFLALMAQGLQAFPDLIP